MDRRAIGACANGWMRQLRDERSALGGIGSKSYYGG
jgi:hypothetical protein